MELKTFVENKKSRKSRETEVHQPRTHLGSGEKVRDTAGTKSAKTEKQVGEKTWKKHKPPFAKGYPGQKTLQEKVQQHANTELHRFIHPNKKKSANWSLLSCKIQILYSHSKHPKHVRLGFFFLSHFLGKFSLKFFVFHFSQIVLKTDKTAWGLR